MTIKRSSSVLLVSVAVSALMWSLAWIGFHVVEGMFGESGLTMMTITLVGSIVGVAPMVWVGVVYIRGGSENRLNTVLSAYQGFLFVTLVSLCLSGLAEVL